MNSPAREKPQPGHARVIFWDLLTFDRLLTGPVVHIIYWCGLGVIVVAAFGVIGASVGIAMLYVAPLSGVYAAVRLVLPVAPACPMPRVCPAFPERLVPHWGPLWWDRNPREMQRRAPAGRGCA